MNAVIYKLLTHDKQARIFLIDNTAMINEAHKPLSGVALDIFNTMLTFTCILHGILENAKRVSVKLETSNPSCYMVFGADSNGDVQGYVSDELIRQPYNSLKEMAGGSGCLKIIYDNGADAIFTGIVEIKEDDIADNLSRYFLQSEQTESIYRHFTVNNAPEIQLSRGVLVQALPFAEKSLISAWAERFDAKKSMIKDTDQPIETLIEAIFPDAAPAEKWPVQLMCSCDRVTVLFMLLGLGSDELEWTINDEKEIEVKCGKCGNTYVFDTEELKSLMDTGN